MLISFDEGEIRPGSPRQILAPARACSDIHEVRR